MKIYTKTGDSGTTSLIGGKRVPKNDLRVESYGTVDELNSFTGLLRDSVISDYCQDVLLNIQKKLFIIQSLLASDNEQYTLKLEKLRDEDIGFLEIEIDKMNEELPALQSFIIPGGNLQSSHSQVARTVCRRAERVVVALSHESKVDEKISQYLNRLSDYFFVLSRYLNKSH